MTPQPSLQSSTPMLRTNPPRRGRKSVLITALLLPAMIVGVAVIGTLLLMGYVSIRQAYPSGDATFTIAHYAAFFTDAYLLEAGLRTIVLGLTVTALCATLGYPVAWYLVMSSSPRVYLVFIIVMTPILVSIVVRTIGWTVLLGNEGLINTSLLYLGIIHEPLRLMQSFWSVTAGMVHVLLPFMILSVCAVLGRIDRDVIAAAMTLGANPRRAFWLITLPLSIQGVATGCVIVFCLAVGAFITPLWLGRGSVPVMALTVREQIIDFADWPNGAVQAVVLTIGALGLIALATLLISRMGRR